MSLHHNRMSTCINIDKVYNLSFFFFLSFPKNQKMISPENVIIVPTSQEILIWMTWRVRMSRGRDCRREKRVKRSINVETEKERKKERKMSRLFCFRFVLILFIFCYIGFAPIGNNFFFLILFSQYLELVSFVSFRPIWTWRTRLIPFHFDGLNLYGHRIYRDTHTGQELRCQTWAHPVIYNSQRRISFWPGNEPSSVWLCVYTSGIRVLGIGM